MILRRRSYLLEGVAGKVKVVLGGYVKDLLDYLSELEDDSNSREWEQWNGRFSPHYTAKMIDAEKKYFSKFKSFDELKKRNHDDYRNSAAKIISGTKKNMGDIARKITTLIGNIPYLGESSIFISPLYKNYEFGKDHVITEPVTSMSVKLSGGSAVVNSGPTFTLFYDPDSGKVEVDDVLDAGDRDFFTNTEVESDYFLLVNEIRRPGSAARQSGKILKLYTARPTSDRHLYDGAKLIPSNIFLTSNENEATGIAQDLSGSGGRDIYFVKIDERYTIKTLDSGRLKQYQAFSKTGMVPVVEIYRI